MNPTSVKPRVLVVDDNRDAATTLTTLLQSAGYEVQTCFDGKSALKVADRFDPVACVLDINMPGMDGYELARKLRAKDPDCPPVLATVTAYGDDNHLTRAADAGFDLHFTKPADPAEVLDQLGDSVRKLNLQRESVRASDGLADGVLAELDGQSDAGDPAPEGRAGVWLAAATLGVLIIAVLTIAIRQAV